MAEKNTKSETGAVGEEIATTFLKRKGYSIIARNYRQVWGELDIVAERAGVVHIVEVKTVSDATIGSRETGDAMPEELAHSEKLRKVVRTAELYMESVGDTREFQIDVVGVVLDPVRRVARCRHFEQVLG